MTKDAIRERNRDYVRKIKETNPCAECGKSYHYSQMDFDHVRGEKRYNIATIANTLASIAKIKEELAKCELVCANCHRLRTWQRLKDEV